MPLNTFKRYSCLCTLTQKLCNNTPILWKSEAADGKIHYAQFSFISQRRVSTKEKAGAITRILTKRKKKKKKCNWYKRTSRLSNNYNNEKGKREKRVSIPTRNEEASTGIPSGANRRWKRILFFALMSAIVCSCSPSWTLRPSGRGWCAAKGRRPLISTRRRRRRGKTTRRRKNTDDEAASHWLPEHQRNFRAREREGKHECREHTLAPPQANTPRLSLNHSFFSSARQIRAEFSLMWDILGGERGNTWRNGNKDSRKASGEGEDEATQRKND